MFFFQFSVAIHLHHFDYKFCQTAYCYKNELLAKFDCFEIGAQKKTRKRFSNRILTKLAIHQIATEKNNEQKVCRLPRLHGYMTVWPSSFKYVFLYLTFNFD